MGITPTKNIMKPIPEHGNFIDVNPLMDLRLQCGRIRVKVRFDVEGNPVSLRCCGATRPVVWSGRSTPVARRPLGIRCVVGNVVDPGLRAGIGKRGIRFEPPFLLWRGDRGCRGHGASRWIRHGRICFDLVHRLIGSPSCSPRVTLSQLLVAAFFDAFKQFFVGCIGVAELHGLEKAFNMDQSLCRKNSLIGPLPSDVLLLGIFLTTWHPLVDAEFTLRL